MDLNQAALREPAIEAAVEVLDTMFFELPADAPQTCDRPCGGSLCALARFTGTAGGTLAVSLDEPALNRLAASFLGAEVDEITPALGSHVLCELTNMLCGATLSRMHPDSRIVIDSPRIVPLNEVSSSPWLRFPLECGSLAVSLTYRGL